MIRLPKAWHVTWSAVARAAVLVGLAIAVAGCGRAPPAPTRQASSSAAKGPEQQTAPPATDVPTAIIRDDRVEPASFVVPLPAPVPKSEQSLAAEALSRIGPSAVPMLVEALKSPDDHIRRQACEVLMRMGPDAKEAVPDLVLLLEDEDQELRKMAAKALGRIGPDAAPAVPALMKTMLEGEAGRGGPSP